MKGVSLEIIPDATLRALSLHHFPLGYLEKGVPQFFDITNKPRLTIEPDDNDQPIMNSEDEKARKGLKL